MRYAHLLLALCALLSSLARAKGSATSVLHARAMLRPFTWCQAISVENPHPKRYPRRFCALVFELNAALWIYIPVDGTQSLSQYRGQVELDQRQLGHLLRLIEPGVTSWSELDEQGMPADPAPPRLPNGCFVESILLMKRVIDRRSGINAPQLLSYYVRTVDGMRGHTVLAFRRSNHVFVIDPEYPGDVQPLPCGKDPDPLELARWVRRDSWKAATVPLDTMRAVMERTLCSTAPITPSARAAHGG